MSRKRLPKSGTPSKSDREARGSDPPRETPRRTAPRTGRPRAPRPELLKIGRVTLYAPTVAKILEACSTLREAARRIGASPKALRRICRARPELACAFVAPPGLVAEWQAAIADCEARSSAIAKMSAHWDASQLRGALSDLDDAQAKRRTLEGACRRHAPALEASLLEWRTARGADPSPAAVLRGVLSAGPASPPDGGRSLPSDAERGQHAIDCDLDEDCQCPAAGWRFAELAENGAAS